MPLKYVKRQNASAANTQMVYRHIAVMQGEEVFGGGVWISDDPTGVFSALLGTSNGNAVAFLVIDHGEKLGIKEVCKIVVDPYQNTTFYFA